MLIMFLKGNVDGKQWLGLCRQHSSPQSKSIFKELKVLCYLVAGLGKTFFFFF